MKKKTFRTLRTSYYVIEERMWEFRVKWLEDGAIFYYNKDYYTGFSDVDDLALWLDDKYSL